MGHQIKVKIKRMKAGDASVRLVSQGCLISGTIPADGFIIQSDEPSALPFFVRDEDIERAKEARKGSIITAIIAKSWEND